MDQVMPNIFGARGGHAMSHTYHIIHPLQFSSHRNAKTHVQYFGHGFDNPPVFYDQQVLCRLINHLMILILKKLKQILDNICDM